MIGIDTNVLVRFFAQDEPLQSKRAEVRIRKAAEAKELIFVNDIVLCELVWVLERAYKFSKATVIEVIEKTLFTKQFAFEDKENLWEALNQFRKSRADFSDVLIGVKNQTAGCRSTITFDKSTESLKTFELLSKA